MENIKLVIWDLDETFWKGTLSEGAVEPIQHNIDIVRALTRRGIVNSIVSKNNFNDAMHVLELWDISDLFIFPQISWDPKGPVIADLLKKCKLKSNNTIFIDDNPLNREEVKFYNEGIWVESPEFLKEILNDEHFKGKEDLDCTRLKHYHILESRTADEKNYGSNHEFLKSSEITLYLGEDCLNKEDRILELIQRTNQLNYTKKRIEREELHSILCDISIHSRYVKAYDKYGDYGIVGFYAFKNNEILHLLFSCRILGMGIEKYIYRKLNMPKIQVNGEVATDLISDSQNIDWIREYKEEYFVDDLENNNTNSKNLLMIGGCDLDQMSIYLKDSGFYVKKEFSTVKNGRMFRTSDTTQLLNSYELDKNIQNELCNLLPFYDNEITFATDIFSDKYDVIVLSVIDDYIRGMYKSKNNDFYVGYAGYFDQEEWLKKFTDDELTYLYTNFDYFGKEPAEIFETNLTKIIEKVSQECQIILINGVELYVPELVGEERCIRNIEMNAVVDRVVEKYNNVSLLDMRRIVNSKLDLIGKDNRHFRRNVYYKMAQQISIIIKHISGISIQYELVNKQVRAELIDRFIELKDKKIVIYGTGMRAEKLIASIKSFNVLGVIDRSQTEGKFFDYEILKIDDLRIKDIDAIIIASDEIYYNEIFERIKDLLSKNTVIYGFNGVKMLR